MLVWAPGMVQDKRWPLHYHPIKSKYPYSRSSGLTLIVSFTGPTWGHPGGPDVGPMKIAIWAFVESTLAIRTRHVFTTWPCHYHIVGSQIIHPLHQKISLHDGCHWNQIFLYWGGIAWRSHQLSVHGGQKGAKKRFGIPAESLETPIRLLEASVGPC